MPPSKQSMQWWTLWQWFSLSLQGWIFTYFAQDGSQTLPWIMKLAATQLATDGGQNTSNCQFYIMWSPQKIVLMQPASLSRSWNPFTLTESLCQNNKQKCDLNLWHQSFPKYICMFFSWEKKKCWFLSASMCFKCYKSTTIHCDWKV